MSWHALLLLDDSAQFNYFTPSEMEAPPYPTIDCIDIILPNVFCCLASNSLMFRTLLRFLDDTEIDQLNGRIVTSSLFIGQVLF